MIMKKIELKQKKNIKELKILKDKLIKENEKIIKELDNKEKLINKYEAELNKLNYEHKQKVQEIVKELIDKGISLDKLNALNNEYEQKIQELKKELNDKEISLNEYKKRLNTLSNTYEKELKELKKELKENKEYINSDKKDKNKVMKKFNELNKEKQEYIKEKQIIEQEINEIKQELDKKEQELRDNKTEIYDLKYQNKLLKEGLDNLKKSIDLKNKENDELKNEIKKDNKAKIKKIVITEDLKRSNMINNSKQLHENPIIVPKMFPDVRKKNDKVRTFAPSDNTTKPSFLEDDYGGEKKSTDKYKTIDLHDIKSLIDRIDRKVTEENDIVDLGNNEKFYFRDVNNFFYDIMNGKINNFNKEKKYEKRFKNIEKKACK